MEVEGKGHGQALLPHTPQSGVKKADGLIPNDLLLVATEIGTREGRAWKDCPTSRGARRDIKRLCAGVAIEISLAVKMVYRQAVSEEKGRQCDQIIARAAEIGRQEALAETDAAAKRARQKYRQLVSGAPSAVQASARLAYDEAKPARTFNFLGDSL